MRPFHIVKALVTHTAIKSPADNDDILEKDSPDLRSMRGIKVLHVGADDTPGGVASYIASMAEEFHRCGIKCLVTVSPVRAAQKSTIFPATYVRIPYSLSYGPWSLWRSALKLHHILIREKICVLHLHTLRAGLVGVLAAVGSHLPVVYTGHGMRFEEKTTCLGRFAFQCFEWLICSLTDCTTMLTKRDRYVAIRSRVVPPHKAALIKTRISGNSHAITANAGGKSLSGFVMGFVGRMDALKDPLTFLNAAALVLQSRADASFLWIGDGELRAIVERKASDLGLSDRLTITGNIPPQKVAEWLSIMTVFVSTSRKEGVPLSILEAFASGVPVVCCRYRGSGWYYVAKSEETALTFIAGDAADCARQVLRLVGDLNLRDQIASGGRQHFITHYSGAYKMAREFSAIYSSLLLQSLQPVVKPA